MQKSSFSLEKKLLSKGYSFIIGIDEAGRGPLAGPVVACAAAYKFFKTSPIPPRRDHPSLIKEGMGEVLLKQFNLIRDSKTLSHKQRESLFDFIHKHFYVGVGICDHRTIDRMNIMQASFLAMKKAIADLQKNLKRLGLSQPKRPKEAEPLEIILLDGNRPIPNFSGEQRAIVNGDRLIKSISAASIIAKVTRDRIMIKMHERYPEYYFHKHKGYGTKLHLRKLKKHGPCKIHRRSFRPVARLVKTQE